MSAPTALDPWEQSVDVRADTGPVRRRLPLYEAGAIPVPFVIRGNTERIARDTHWDEHSHPTHELLWNDHGASTATVGDRVWTVTPHHALWIPAGVRHTGWTPAGTWQRAAMFSVDQVPAISELPTAVELTPLLRLLLDRLSAAGLDDRARATTEATILDVLEPAEHELLLRLPRSALLAPIVERLRASPSDGTSLAEWATFLGVSTRTVTRTFESETGLGFARWVAAARVQHAITRLIAGDGIDEVAAAVGYRSTTAFGTAFRRVTGTSPGRFRAG
ncbi:AraC family transcriptional regulator [Plantibacter sp. Leaf314]|uniref:helix-turn-helix domain-containing protein n=1 Tax=Plantibacter sp. Leaf314 TaxID=1736333 RepID=UPI0009E959FB|nr:AraC family transcriptional regulator [Plantibacter sp. Leaf314]